MPSKDLRGTSTSRAQEACGYINVVQPTAKYLNMLVKAFFPKEFAKLKQRKLQDVGPQKLTKNVFLALPQYGSFKLVLMWIKKTMRSVPLLAGVLFRGPLASYRLEFYITVS